MNDLGLRLLPDRQTSAFIIVTFLSTSTASLLTNRNLWLYWFLVYAVSIVGNWTTSDNKNYQTSGLKLLKNVAAISSRKSSSCVSSYILNRTWCKTCVPTGLSSPEYPYYNKMLWYKYIILKIYGYTPLHFWIKLHWKISRVSHWIFFKALQKDVYSLFLQCTDVRFSTPAQRYQVN